MKNTLYLTFAWLLLCNFSFAQNTKTPAAKPLVLDELEGYTQTYFYSPGYKERASSIAELMEKAGRFFKQEIGFMPTTVLFILGPHHWKDFAAHPLQDVYGFPHNLDKRQLVIAAEDNDFWRSFLPSINQLPPVIAKQITKAYGKGDGSLSMMPFFDLLALHEMGHSYTAQAGLNMQRNWMSELFVNIMLHTYVAEKQPELLPALEAFPNMVVSKGAEEYTYTSLQDFETLYASMGMGPKNYGWYQCNFHSAAKDIYNASGKTVVKQLWEALKVHQENMTDEAFIRMLRKEVHPSVASVYLNWNTTH